MSTTEHIVLESDIRPAPDVRTARKIHARFGLRSRLRRRALQLQIIDYYYLSVRSWRSRALAEYVLDLRFVDARPRLSRRIAWRWMTATVILIALASGIAARIGSSAPLWWQRDSLPLCITVVLLGTIAALVCVYRTTETVTLYSAHGQAGLLEVTGGLGTLRAIRLFMTKLAAHVQLATATRRPSKSEHLRDEMREHFRLKEIGVLSTDEYEAGKVRILRQHSPSLRSSLARNSTPLCAAQAES